MSREFYLVQRLTRRDMPSAKGFDRLFGCQYMGSAEFEWGAIPESLKRIRGARKVVIHEGQVARGDSTVPVFVIGPKATVEGIPDRLTTWLQDPWPHGKERSYFPEYVEGAVPEYMSADAWWALNEDVMWTLDGHIADVLLMAVTS